MHRPFGYGCLYNIWLEQRTNKQTWFVVVVCFSAGYGTDDLFFISESFKSSDDLCTICWFEGLLCFVLFSSLYQVSYLAKDEYQRSMEVFCVHMHVTAFLASVSFLLIEYRRYMQGGGPTCFSSCGYFFSCQFVTTTMMTGPMKICHRCNVCDCVS